MELLTHLSAIGFTEYEAKVYIALLADHPATGYQLSKQAGIPRSMVYEALGRLDTRGAVLKSEDVKATVYRPVPPDALLNRLSEEYGDRIAVLRSGLHTIYTARDEARLWTITGEGPVLSYAEDMITRASHEAMLVLTDSNLEALHEAINDADQRGVSMGTLLTGSATLDIGQVAYHPPRESEVHKLADSLIVVIDEQEVLIASSQGLTYAATITTNTNMVQIGRQFVWMELFAHRVLSQLNVSALEKLSPQDRSILGTIGGEFTDSDYSINR